MSIPANTTEPARPTLRFRRPPAPVGPWATVSRLTPPGRHSDEPDDVPVAVVQGTLALDLDGPADEEPRCPGRSSDPLPGRDLDASAARFARTVLEVLAGDRPASQLLRLTNARVYEEITRRVRVLARTAPAPARLRTLRAHVRSVHVFQPAVGCAEVCVHVRQGHRSRAFAARLEHHDGRWTCTDLQLG